MKPMLDKAIALNYSGFKVSIFSGLKKLRSLIRSFLKTLSKKQQIGLAVFFFLLLSVPLTVTAVRYRAYQRSRAFQIPPTTPTHPIPTPTPTLVGLACNPNDRGLISVEEYNRSDSLPGLRITVTSNTYYQNEDLKITPEGSDGWFIGRANAVSGGPGQPYGWHWETVRPVNPNYKIEFYINHSRQANGQPCGEWSSYPVAPTLTPTPTPTPKPATPTPTPILCTDSDGGKNYYQKGRIVHYRGTFNDYCQHPPVAPEGTLLEGFCLDRPDAMGNVHSSVQYLCPYGCQDGACLPRPEGPTPTATPTPIIIYPTATPTLFYATPTPVPTLPPVINHNPQIITDYLRPAIWNRQYSARIVAIDEDTDDQLSMTISALPQGLYQGKCSYSRPWYRFLRRRMFSWINCRIRGVPQQAGNFRVQVLVTDGKGGQNIKSIPLYVIQERKFLDFFRFR